MASPLRSEKLPSPNPMTDSSDSPTPLTKEFDDTRHVLVSYSELPEWYHDNNHILQGYRPVSNSTRACFSSWLYLHNETVNIFSHLLPAALFLLAETALYSFFHLKYPHATAGDRLIFAFFLLTGVICLGLSVAYHTLMNHSEHVSHFWLRLDFVGIVVLTLGDFVSGIYMVFYCESGLQKIYWAMIGILGLGTILVLVSPRFQGPRWRAFRVCAFVRTGLSGFAPLVHGIVKFGFSQMVKQSGLPYYLAEGGLLGLGALFYTMRIPETFKPGMFDIVGCSHQIFHILVVLATVVQLVGILNAFDYNYNNRSCGGGFLNSHVS